jgi:predicted transcriptional regulator
MNIVREEAKKIIEKLPEEASWDDLIYELYARKKIDEGIKAAEEGRLLSHEEVKQRFSGK